MSGQIAVVRGKDGRVLGVTFDGDKCLSREECSDWVEFLESVGHLAFSRIPEDTNSPHAKRMLAKDARRLRKLLANGGGK